MLLAIDVGNTNIVIGHHDGTKWLSFWRLPTKLEMTEDSLGAIYLTLCKEANIPIKPSTVICASVVPPLNIVLEQFAEKYLSSKIVFLSSEILPNMEIRYEPRDAVGADRLANAIAAKAKYPLPAIVVDFGTATTFDAIGPNGEYLGGSIFPGIELSMEALFSKTAKLPRVELRHPGKAIGESTVMSLQSGLVIGYAGAIDTLIRDFKAELGGKAKVIATGGIAKLFASHCKEIEEIDPMLTLEGLRISLDFIGKESK
ncbi:MAG TPA: type III pantothenate kinase [Fimbriimonadales bacterium]|nr:type III pantothenate kinase [Fimbriimonadales bacterium]